MGVLRAWDLRVILVNPGHDLARQATALLTEWGPVQAGSPAGDFTVITLSARPGWVVTSHHPDILTCVGPDEVPPGASEGYMGLPGGSGRDADAREPKVVHVEDRPPRG